MSAVLGARNQPGRIADGVSVAAGATFECRDYVVANRYVRTIAIRWSSTLPGVLRVERASPGRTDFRRAEAADVTLLLADTPVGQAEVFRLGALVGETYRVFFVADAANAGPATFNASVAEERN